MTKNEHVDSLDTIGNEKSVKIAVVGSGYVGLVVAACFAEIGHSVICVDNDEAKIMSLKQGHVPIHEDLLAELLAKHIDHGLTFTTSLREAVHRSEAVFIAVGTPAHENGEADLTYVEQVAAEISHAVNGYKVIVEKSTVPVTTCDTITRVLLERGVSRGDFEVVSNPEFLREGTAVCDFLHPDRIVVGTQSDKAFAVLHRIYLPLTSGEYFNSEGCIQGSRSAINPAPLLRTSTKSAELIKHASNAFLAMKISFINSVANVCEAVGADISEVAKGVGMDQRIGPKFLRAGLGYGGSCFPKDIRAFRAIANRAGVDLKLLHEVERINEMQQEGFLEKVRSSLGKLRGKRLGVLGLAFKGGTDDIRQSPAVNLVRSFLAEGSSVIAYDPAAMENANNVLPAENLEFARDAYQVMERSDALVILTDWPEFAKLDLGEMKRRLKRPLVLDGRNLFSDAAMKKAGFTYHCVGVAGHDERAAAGPHLSGRRTMQAMVTGAAGFLGSHLVDALLDDGYSVIGVDNLLTGRLQNIEHLRTNPRFRFLEQDITVPFDAGRIDLVFNMASPASPIDYTVHGVETLLVGSAGTRNVLELARRYNAKFLHCSTSECYGDPQVHPQTESYWGHVNPIGPRSVYDEAKRFSEALIMAYHRYYNVDTRIVRIFNTYGPRLQLNDGRVISNFLRQALRGEDLTVYGDGSQTRSFCYVSDQVEGLMRLMRSDEHYPVNIGNPEEFTILDCAEQILAATGSSSKITYHPLPQDDPKQRCPDITKARTLLGWEPKVNLAQGLELSIPWFIENLNLEAEDVDGKNGLSVPAIAANAAEMADAMQSAVDE